MTASPDQTSPRPAVVTRVVDYEPPVAVSRTRATSTDSALSARSRHLHVVRPADPASPHRRSATAFTDAALRSVLEVIDQRRPAIQLRPLMVGGLADTVAALGRTQDPRRAAAVLRRARLQATDTDDHAFEVAAVYSRGSRSHAMACRVELISTPRGVRWQLTALHLG